MESRMISIGSTLSKKSLVPGCDRSSTRRLNVGTGQSGSGCAGGGGAIDVVVAGKLQDHVTHLGVIKR